MAQALLLTQQKLSTEKYLDEANARIEALETEIVSLREKQLEVQATNSSTVPNAPDTGVSTKKSRWWPWQHIIFEDTAYFRLFVSVSGDLHTDVGQTFPHQDFQQLVKCIDNQGNGRHIYKKIEF